MSHQEELEKKKYRNWVRGGLAYKYLKYGIKGFTDDVVHEEHRRIIQDIISGSSCNQCSLRNLRPLHTCKKDHTGRNECPWGQNSCNCLYTKKQRCPNNVCDAIMEDILKNHGSAPPSPNWKNTDTQKWCSAPWEIAKCFINAPGYSDKSKADDIDIAGLLHVFINNISHKSHLSDKINTGDILSKILQRRNELFHSPNMEIEEIKLNECIDEIISVLEDEKELKARKDAQEAILKLKQLKQNEFIITTQNEAEICRDAFTFITNKAEELKQTIEGAKNDIAKKQEEATEAVGNETRKVLRDSLGESDNQNVTLYDRVGRLEQRLTLLEGKVDNLETIRQNQKKRLDYVEGKQALQNGLVKLYQQHYVKTSCSPLKSHENNISVNEIYVAPNIAVEEQTKPNNGEDRQGQTRAPERIYIHGYREIFQTSGQKHKSIYIVGDVGTGKSSFCKMMIQNWCTAIIGDSITVVNGSKSVNSTEPDTGTTCKDINELDTGYNELSSAFSWPSIFDSSDSDNFVLTSDSDDDSLIIDHECSNAVDANINEMRNFDFLFFLPLQKMSGLSDITEMIKAIVTDAGLASIEVIDGILDHESERCLIVADGLDEWTVPKDKCRLPHVSNGLPKSDRAKNATVVTLSRPSAKGILNLKSSEYDKKMELLGIRIRFVKSFIEKYLSKSSNKDVSSKALMKKIKSGKLKHLEKTPLLLQQLIWLYCNGNETGKSISDTYSHIINIIFGWTQNKKEEEVTDDDQTGDKNEDKDENLPRMLQRFDRCEENKNIILPLAKVAFEALTSETGSNTFDRRHLRRRNVQNYCITTLIKLGILVEENCFDPTKRNTRLAFIHMSYLEFFAAVHVSSQCNNKHQNIILEDLFRSCKSAADILQLSNVLKMICGLSPYLISDLSKIISEFVSRDESMIAQRNALPGYRWKESHKESVQMQRLMLTCMSEGGSGDHLMFGLCDVIIDGKIKMSLLQRIILENVVCLYVVFTQNVEVGRWIEQMKQLQYLHIVYSALSHSEAVLLYSFIQEAPLRCLSLDLVYCNQSDCKGHMIDLSKQNKLQKLQLVKSVKLVVTNINTEELEVLHLDSFGYLDTNILVNASRLTELLLAGNIYPYINYNKQVDSVVHTLHQLRKLSLDSLDIDTNALTVTPEMRNLEHIELDMVAMSLETWQTFVDSLLTLQQSVSVQNDTISPVSDSYFRHYVRQNKMFEVAGDEILNFKTKK